MIRGHSKPFYSYPADPEFDAEGNCISALDWRGNRFHVGETVMYCIGAGRGQRMAIGQVLEMQAEPRKTKTERLIRPGETPTRTYETTWEKTPRLIELIEVEEHYHDFKIKVLTEETSGEWDGEKRTRPAWPQPVNMTAIPQVEEAA